MPRKKNKPARIKFTAYVLPKTQKAIKKRVVKGNPKLGTPGKVIDEQFEQQP